MKKSTKDKDHSPPHARDNTRWAAVVARDESICGEFYYGVVTTGVYCRPSCPSRRAKRSNVRFFSNVKDAEASGFRACKRCKPNGRSSQVDNIERITRACRLIESSPDPLTLSYLSAHAGMSPYHFHRLFKSVTGLTPKSYSVAHRNKRLRETIKTKRSVTEAMLESGFNSSSPFYAVAQAALGMTPRSFREGGLNHILHYAIGICFLGHILVASTGRGVCAVLLGDEADTLLSDLKSRFPNAVIEPAKPGFQNVVSRVIACIEKPDARFDLPLDIQGTAFQHKVWRALREIPAGKTLSYSEVASNIGSPKAVRAVASACAANPVAVIIPCHRVIGSKGAMTGYRWGIKRKRVLLGRES